MKDKNRLSDGEEQKVKKQTVLKLIALILITGGVFALYRILISFDLIFIFWVYLAVFSAIIAAYIIYNRGLPSKEPTADMLPDEWSYAQKEAFIEDAARRRKNSAWMLMLIIAFIFTFAFEMLELYALPFIEEMLK